MRNGSANRQREQSACQCEMMMMRRQSSYYITIHWQLKLLWGRELSTAPCLFAAPPPILQHAPRACAADRANIMSVTVSSSRLHRLVRHHSWPKGCLRQASAACCPPRSRPRCKCGHVHSGSPPASHIDDTCPLGVFASNMAPLAAILTNATAAHLAR